MKITIQLSDSEVKGIKNYLRDVDGNKRPNKKDVQLFIAGYVQAINSPEESVSEYIGRAKNA